MTMWAITCDHEGCDVSTDDLTGGEILAWANDDQAVDHWLGCGGTTDGAGHHYCVDHRDMGDES